MARVIWTAPALSDLEEIARYIAMDKPNAARRLVHKIFDGVGCLESFPESGRHPPELESSRYRELIIGPCRVFYRLDGEQVYILHIMRGERQLRKFLLTERD
ncbi:MAG: plasmid stabilization protein [Methylothermaceae bacteria B42]|nr:MAG: plasmid stabilization protein [Methylothermaceae bacteria B42]HHJ40139.1 type II toxin-antitoxin system RelE/ParE family toxin [Methylothermaceae bacterium]